ncbi:winged helix DNA-binding protein [Streptomyces sp. SID2131]|nr:winged helix DNA-binding protein [Streptomyces sp. SID2131]
MTPPSVLDLNAYLMYALGKAARRRLQERLTTRGLRLWHLTVLALLSDLGPQMKTVLAARLDMNASDLVRIVDDLVKTGYVECDRDPEDRRRVVVRLTPEGGSALAELGADVASADDELLAPLDAEERRLLSSLLRRVHARLEAGARTAARP